LIEALRAVVHLPLNVNEDEGYRLSEEYQVGFTYPVFVLTDSEGEVIDRWIGYTGGASRFISTLREALRDLTTVEQRIASFERNPTYKEGLYLAGYHSKTGEYLKAVDFYRKSVALGEKKYNDYSYEIFYNMANAVWNDQAPFDSLLPAADAVLNSDNRLVGRVFKVAQLITRVARKCGRSGETSEYLQAGIEETGGEQGYEMEGKNALLRADYALYIEKDTARALEIKKTSLGTGWEEDRDRFYNYAKWCLEREINLAEAEDYARKVINLVYPGKFRARAYNTVAEICYARGNTDEAIRIINLAIDEDPDNRLYHNQLKRFRGDNDSQ